MRRILAGLAALGIVGLLAWAFVEGRAEMRREREREAPIIVHPRIGRTSSGEAAILLDDEGLRLAAIETAPARAVSGRAAAPRGAILRYDGRQWAFVEAEPGRYVRRQLELAEPLDEGWLVRRGVAPGEKIVTVGAQTLLSEELKSAIQIGD